MDPKKKKKKGLVTTRMRRAELGAKKREKSIVSLLRFSLGRYSSKSLVLDKITCGHFGGRGLDVFLVSEYRVQYEDGK